MAGVGFQLQKELAGNVLILRLSGELDIGTAELFRQEADEHLRSARARAVVLGCRGLTFLDSTGLGAILGRYRLWQERGGRMVAAGAAGRVKTMWEISGVAKLIPLYDSERKAIQALGGEVR